MKNQYDYCIIGGGVAGVTAAETIRSRDSDGTIGVFSTEPYRLYSRVLLPHYVKGEVERGKLFLRKEDDYERNRIDFHPGTEISFVNTEKREIGLHDHTMIAYKKLLIASGGEVAPSSLDELAEYRYRLQTLDDADRLHEAFRAKRFERPLVVGGSFIALEFLSICAAYKISARVLFRGEHFFSRIMGPEGGELMKRVCIDHGFEFVSDSEIGEVLEGEHALRITTSHLLEIEHDALFLATGIRRSVSSLAGSGVEIGEGVKTNEFLETAAPGVFAAGDVAEYFDPIFAKHRMVGNWTNAFLQGKLAGFNMTGEKLAIRVVSAYAAAHFGLAITAIGECSGVEGSVERADFKKNSYERYFFSGDLLIGAVLVNRSDIRAHVATLIETKTPVGDLREKFRHHAFDIREISVVKS